MINNINSYKHIATATTTQVFTGRATLVAIVVNTTAAGAITIYDEIGADVTNSIGILQASVLPGTFLYNITMGKGIKIVTAGASDVTIVYRLQ